MALDCTRIDRSAVLLHTRIPEWSRVTGLEYGAHVSMGAQGWSGYYVRPPGSARWGLARLTPAANELPAPDPDLAESLDQAIVRCIAEELGS
jgi:hypothetical protein